MSNHLGHTSIGLKPFIVIVTAVILALSNSKLYANSVEINLNSVQGRSPYMLDLLKLALAYSGNRYQFNETNERLSKTAEREATVAGELTLFWGATSEEDENNQIPIRIDAYRGLMSLRFFIIRADTQAQFAKIKNLGDLSSIIFGQGCSWTDTTILRNAGLRVECTHKKEGLFYMLEGGRFDAFPRGATEAWVEAEQYKALDLTVEKTLVFEYPLPSYFFVSKQYPDIARDIETGLLTMIEDGSFEQFFYGNPQVATFLEQANLDKRTIIKIDNPFVPPASIEAMKTYTIPHAELTQAFNAYMERQKQQEPTQ